MQLSFPESRQFSRKPSKDTKGNFDLIDQELLDGDFKKDKKNRVNHLSIPEPKVKKIKKEKQIAAVKVHTKLPDSLAKFQEGIKTPIFSKLSPDGKTAHVKKWRYAPD